MSALASAIRVTSLAICFLTADFALASEEEFIPWQSVSLRSPKLPEAGIVTVDAVQDQNGYQKFALTAFGRLYSLSSADLKRLHSFPLSSLSLRHEAGYVQLGGYTVHARLERIYYDQLAKKTVHEAIYISIPKNGELRISDPRAIGN